MHAKWLAKLTVRDPESGELRPYSRVEIYRHCEQLPAYLAARSYSLFAQRKSSTKSDPGQKRWGGKGDNYRVAAIEIAKRTALKAGQTKRKPKTGLLEQ